MRLPGALAATVFSNLLFGLSFPPVSWRPLGMLCLVPFLLALRGASLPRAALLGLVWSVGAAYAVGDAMPGMVEVYFLQPRLLGWLFFLGIALASSTPYYGSFALAYPTLLRRAGPLWRPLLVAAAWTAVELGRGRLLTPTTVAVGNPWALLGYSQVGWPVMLQIASVTGIYGVSFALVALNQGLSDLIGSAWDERRVPGRALAALGVAAAPLAVVLGFGVAVLSAAPAVDVTVGHRKVAMVQANLDLGSRWRPEFYGRNLDAYTRLSLEAVEAQAPEVVVWPESAFTFVVEDDPAFERALARLTRGTGAELVAGGPGVGEGDPPVYFNSVFVMDTDGEMRGRYDKRHLLPFTEFFPLRDVEFLRSRFERVQFFTHGRRTAPLPSRLGPAGVVICNEGMLPEVAAARVRDGATWLVNPSNDSWMATARWGEMMFDMISVRAVEQRRYLVRASTSGPSGVVDPWGRVRVRTTPLTDAVAVGWVAPRDTPSLYARCGDSFGFGCLALTAVVLLRWRRRGAEPAIG